MNKDDKILDDDFIVGDNQIFENASIIRRYCNGFIDVSFIIIIYGLATDLFLSNTIINKMGDYQSKLIFTMYGSIIFYYLFFEFICKGRTIGKFITKTKVIDKAGNPPSFIQVIKRILARYMPFEFFTILIRENKTTLHDGASGTRVIKIKKIK